MTIYDKALEIATRAHLGQTRRDGTPYINHPIAVAGLVEKSWSESARNNKNRIYYLSLAVAISHDICEDCHGYSEIGILRELEDTGFINAASFEASWLLDSLNFLNKNHYNSYLDYIVAIKKNDIAKRVKIADLTHNLSDLGKSSLKDKYELAKYILEN